jgi:hypothetical protein
LAAIEQHDFNNIYREDPGMHCWFVWRTFLGDFGSTLLR